jgi:peptidoglycan hydrolase-like protein with peptidoglycan-binding domain
MQLQQLVNNLRTQLGLPPLNVPGGPSSASGTSAAYTRDLTLGDSGTDVTALQTFLIQQNKGPAAQALAAVGATGYFGPLTRAALAEYQAAVGIAPAVGYFGPITRAHLGGV